MPEEEYGEDYEESTPEPEIIIPRYKLIVCYDVLPASRDTYYQFILGELVPSAQQMGLYMTEAWHTAYGEYPLRMASFVAEDLDTVREALGSQEWRELEARFLTYVDNYSRKLVPFREGFQF